MTTIFKIQSQCDMQSDLSPQNQTNDFHRGPCIDPTVIQTTTDKSSTQNPLTLKLFLIICLMQTICDEVDFLLPPRCISPSFTQLKWWILQRWCREGAPVSPQVSAAADRASHHLHLRTTSGSLLNLSCTQQITQRTCGENPMIQ